MPSSMRARAPQLRRPRTAGAAVALVLAVLAVLAPVPAHAVDPPAPDGATPATAIPLPVADLDSQFTADTSARSGAPHAGQRWHNVVWYSWTAAETVRVSVRATSLAPLGWDNTLEVWSNGDLIVSVDDAYGLDAAVRVDLQAGRQYLIGVGGYSSTARGTATIQLTTRVPTAPVGLTATGGDEAVTLTWNPPSDVAGGVVRYVVTCTPPGTPAFACGSFTGAPPATTHTISGLTNGVTYEFHVTAENVLGESVPSATVTGTPQAPSTTSLRTEPAAPVSGQPFSLYVEVGRPGTSTTVDVTVGADVRTGVPLVDGVAVVPGLVASAGALHLAATYTGDAVTRGSSAAVDVTVARRPDVVTLAALPTDLVYAGAGIALAATSGQGLPLTYTATGACALSGTTLHLVDVGVCTVTASHAGSAEVEPASATVGAQVGQRSQQVTIAPLPALVVGGSPVEVVAASDAALPVALAASGACLVDGACSS